MSDQEMPSSEPPATDLPETGPSTGSSLDGWGTRIGVILAVAGSAVGLGNFLRFPGQAAQNGGGAFMIPYFISLLVLGIPLCWAEWTMGRYGGSRGFNSAPGIYSVLWKSRFAKYLGVIALLIPLVIYMYYVLIESWCLIYALGYLFNDPELVDKGADYGAYFETVTGQSADGALLNPNAYGKLSILALVFSFNFILIYRGISKGIETFCRIAMPLMVVLALIVLCRVMTLSPVEGRSVSDGLGFMWNPDFSVLWNSKTWLAAAGQIFFSISVGFGIIVNYASYLKRKDEVILSGLTSLSVNEFFEVCLGGLITLPAAFIFLGVAAGEQGTFGLGFNALPNVFAQMPGGQVVGFLWFFMLFIAAITSSVSMLQPVIAFFEEGFGLKRHASAAFLGLLTAIGSLFVLYFSKDMVALDMFDFWVGSVLLFLLALAQSVIYGWAFGVKRGDEEMNLGSQLHVPRFVQYMLKYVIPIYLSVIFVAFVWQGAFSHDTVFATLPTELTSEISEDALGEPLLQAIVESEDLAEEGIIITDEMRFLASESADSWEAYLVDEEGTTATQFVLTKSSEGLEVSKHKAGYIENISKSGPASLSIAFIGLISVFLALLIHIAGKRWKQQGLLS